MNKNAPLFPIFLKLEGRTCLVVGAGPVGEGKIRSLLDSGARVRVVSPTATSRVSEWAKANLISWQARRFQKTDFESALLVVAATSSTEVNDEIFAEAQRQRVLCNVVDVPDRCDFYYPSTVRRGDLQIAISTAGHSPLLAQRLRKELEQDLPEQLGPWLDEIGEARRLLFRTQPDPARRLEALREISSQATFENFLRRDFQSKSKELS